MIPDCLHVSKNRLDSSEIGNAAPSSFDLENCDAVTDTDWHQCELSHWKKKKKQLITYKVNNGC